MKAEYDFSQGKRAAILPSAGKTKITIYIDDNILAELRSRAEQAGTGYQTMINDALREYLSTSAEQPVTETILRRVLQEEFPRIVRVASRSV